MAKSCAYIPSLGKGNRTLTHVNFWLVLQKGAWSWLAETAFSAFLNCLAIISDIHKMLSEMDKDYFIQFYISDIDWFL